MIDTRGMWAGRGGGWAASRGAEVTCSDTKYNSAPISKKSPKSESIDMDNYIFGFVCCPSLYRYFPTADCRSSPPPHDFTRYLDPMYRPSSDTEVEVDFMISIYWSPSSVLPSSIPQ